MEEEGIIDGSNNKKALLQDLMKTIVQCSTRDSIKDALADREALETVIALFGDMDFVKAKESVEQWRREKIMDEQTEFTQTIPESGQISAPLLRMNYKEIINHCLKENNVKKSELARRLNTSPQSVNDWVNRGQTITIKTFYKILNASSFDIVIRNRVITNKWKIVLLFEQTTYSLLYRCISSF